MASRIVDTIIDGMDSKINSIKRIPDIMMWNDLTDQVLGKVNEIEIE